ncbi:hypothetical protein ACQJBY_054501 [Aegilops geniculata]
MSQRSQHKKSAAKNTRQQENVHRSTTMQRITIRPSSMAGMVLDEPLSYSLDDCIEYIQEDELVEVTPESIRMSKNPKISKKKNN